MRTRRFLRRPRGQSLVEYLVVAAFVLGVGTLGWPWFVLMLRAFDIFYKSIYFVLRSPVP